MIDIKAKNLILNAANDIIFDVKSSGGDIKDLATRTLELCARNSIFKNLLKEVDSYENLERKTIKLLKTIWE